MSGAYPVLHVGSFGSADARGPVGSARTRGPWVRVFRGAPASVPEARRFVGELLAGCPAREVLMTCVSELTANAIVHTASGGGGVFIVEVACPRDGLARVAVTDEGAPSVPAAGKLDPAPALGRLHQPVGLRRRLPGTHGMGGSLLAGRRPVARAAGQVRAGLTAAPLRRFLRSW